MHSEGWAVFSPSSSPLWAARASPAVTGPNWRQLSPNWDVEHCPVQPLSCTKPWVPTALWKLLVFFSPFKHIFAHRTVWELFLELFLAQQFKGAVLPLTSAGVLPFQFLFCSLQSSTSTADVSLLRGGSSRALLYFLQPVLSKKKRIFIVIMSNQTALNKLQWKEWIFRLYYIQIFLFFLRYWLAKKYLHQYWKDWNPWFLFRGFSSRSEICFLNVGCCTSKFC